MLFRFAVLTIVYLSGRAKQMIYDDRLSAIQQVWYVVLQGSVLGHLLFVTLELAI